MNDNSRKGEKTPSLRIILLLFSLFASISLSPSEYVKCESLFPDEIFEICKVSQKQSPGLSLYTLIASPITPPHSWNSSLPLEVCLPEWMNPRMELAAIMRC